MEENEIIQWLPGYTVTPQYTRNNTQKEDYNNYQEDIQKDKEKDTINKHTGKIRQGRDQFAMDYILPWYLSLSNPVAYSVSSIGGASVDKLAKAGGYNGWSNMLFKKFNVRDPLVLGFSNPGYFLGTGGLGQVARRQLSARSKGLLDNIKYQIQDRVEALKTYSKVSNKDLPIAQNLITEEMINNTPAKLTRLGAVYPDGQQIQLLGEFPFTKNIKFGALFGKGSATAAIPNKISTPAARILKKGVDSLPSGTTLSGSAPAPTLAQQMAANIPTNHPNILRLKTFLEGGHTSKNKGLSSYAYELLSKFGKRPGHRLQYTAGVSGNFNPTYPSNITKWQNRYLKGDIDAPTYVEHLNEWIKSFGGRPARVSITGRPVVYHPAVFIE